jgi:hypothetical protein
VVRQLQDSTAALQDLETKYSKVRPPLSLTN